MVDRVFVVVAPMLSGVFVIMHQFVLGMLVFVGMLMNVFVSVFVSMFMSVHLVPMGVFMGVRMGVLMNVEMFVFVFSFHNEKLLSRGCWSFLDLLFIIIEAFRVLSNKLHR